ncbi:MAG: flavodoxin [Gammaproteobacteria bacterium]|nr:MAG: flavodoxin [Gammaproteobacteria bacterium]RLA51819.1 MAG: flavodoxin [Gammaproteobacteria bacterium]
MAGDIGLFYGSTTCYTEIVAEKIRDSIGATRVDLFNIADQPIALARSYRRLILGIPTWDYGELQEDWETIWATIPDIDWRGKTVALYGLGDQIGYPEWFQDAMGYLWANITSLGANCIGQWPTRGYSYTNSQAITKDGAFFVGLALDEDSDFELSDERIERWCQQIIEEFEAASSQ